MLWIFIIIITLIVIGLILYWQLIVAEGAYLGAPLVALLYDWTAEKYNKIKDFDWEAEAYCLGAPLTNRLHRQPEALVLDVATGTGRIPLTLFDQADFQGRVVGLDRAAKMLSVAQQDTMAAGTRLLLLQADAMALPFADDTFSMVTCLEALEFFPNPEKGLAELIRVLRSQSDRQPRDGWLVISNRIGWEARLMPGKTWDRTQVKTVLARFQLQYVEVQVWQDIYDLVWGQKVVKGAEIGRLGD